MSLTIENPEVASLARELASATGETVTAAIRHALEDRLRAIRKERDVEARIRRIDEILDSLPPVPPGVTSNHDDLYDEDGLPA